MITRHAKGGITWIDLESPTHRELDEIMDEFSIDDHVREEIITPTHYPLVNVYPKYAYLILHFPTADPKSGTRNQEIDFIIGKNFLITARYEIIDTIHNLHHVFEAEKLLGLGKKGSHAGHLLERILKRMYGAIREEMERAAELLESIEEDMFSGKERDTVRGISDIGRVLLRFETTIARQQEPFHIFLRRLADPSLFGPGFTAHASHIEAQRAYVADIVSSYRAAATELRATNDSLLSASQNEVMKTLTLIASISSPFAIVAGIFGMNVDHTPFSDLQNAFWIILTLGLLSSASLLVFFRVKHWF